MKFRVTLLAVATMLATNHAFAGGLFASDRGVRPLSRGGAFVAGADDLGAIWYNPAGLADAGSSLLLDASVVNFSSEFTRRTNVTTTSGAVQTLSFPTVNGTTPMVPIPTIAGSRAFGRRNEWTVALGVFAPYAGLVTYPTTASDGSPAGSRYSLLSLEGSKLLVPGVYVAFKPTDRIRIGAGFQTLVGNSNTTVMFSASPPDRLIAAPEDPRYDAKSELKAGPVFAPSANVGVIASVTDHVRVGASVQLPFWINAPAELNVRLPNAPTFDRARQEGNTGRVKFRLPAVLRLGAEYRRKLSDDVSMRLEAAYVRDFWSLHDRIDVEPDNVKLYDIIGFPSPVQVSPVSLRQNFQDSNSFRLGTEFSFGGLIKNSTLDARGGVAYETSAIPTEWVSPRAFDSNKVIPALGLGLSLGSHWRFDAMGALILYSDQNVDPGQAQVSRVNPIRGNPTELEAINGGSYRAKGSVFGIGVNYKFDTPSGRSTNL